MVASRRTETASLDEMRKALRAVLTQMVLAGMQRSEISLLVTGELRGLIKGAR